MARDREPVRIEHGSGPPDVSGEDIVGWDGTLRLAGEALTLSFTRRRQPHEVVIPLGGLASVVLGVQDAKTKRFPFRVCTYDGDVYVVEFGATQARSFLRLSYAVSAAGVKVTEEPPSPQQQATSSVGFFIGF